MDNSPQVTVLMAVYNGERYLCKSIDSILSQKFTNFEFLIINDGSSDSSRDIILSYDDPRIRLIDNTQNMGLTKSLNYGFGLARGMYVARQDADDISEPQRLAKQVGYMDSNPHLALLGTWYREIDENGAFLDNIRLPSDYTELRWALLFYCAFVHSAIILRKSLFLEQIGVYDEKYVYAQDYELWLRAARHRPVSNYRESLVRYRISPYSMTATYGDRVNEAILISTGAIGSLLDWDERDHVVNVTCTKKMFEVLYGEFVTLHLKELHKTTEQIFRLHQAFCNHYQLDLEQSRRHMSILRAWLSKRYVRIAHQKLMNGNRLEAQRIYINGLRLHQRGFFTKKSAEFLHEMLIHL